MHGKRAKEGRNERDGKRDGRGEGEGENNIDISKHTYPIGTAWTLTPVEQSQQPRTLARQHEVIDLLVGANCGSYNEVF